VSLAGTVLITGTSGQVGSALLGLMRERTPGMQIAAPTRAEMDLANADSIRTYVRSVAPRWIVSNGAYTAVDAAETDRDAAYAANATAPGVLAEEAAKLGAGIIHLSTDYVFPGTGTHPWVETDPTAPLNVYGASKLSGEQAIAATGAAHIILRTSWVYSGGGKNFVRTMLRLLSTKTDPLRVVADQHGSPTSATDLADAILGLMVATEFESPNSDAPLAEALGSRGGIYHCTGMGETTWAGLAGAVREYLIREHGMTPPEIIGVGSSEYPTPAARPLNSRMDCTRLFANFGIRLPHWHDSVEVALQQLAATDLQPR
jgi:dTDP-4-dehydrorhamnose reductase